MKVPVDAASAVRLTAVWAGIVVAEAPGRMLRAATHTKSVLSFTLVIIFGVVGALGVANGTWASLSAANTVAGAKISSGNDAITLQAAGTTAGTTTTIPSAAWSNMLPGDIVGQQVQVVNTGTIPVQLTFALAASTAWDIRVAWGTCPTTQITNGSITTTPQNGNIIAAGYNNTMCVQATLPTSAPASVAGTSPNMNLLIGASQVSS